MPKLNLDERAQLHDPIEVVVNGKTYTVGKVSPELMERVANVANETENQSTAPSRQLGMLFNVEPEVFNDLDIRDIRDILEFVTKELAGAVEKKA